MKRRKRWPVAGDVTVEHERGGFRDGRSCIAITFEGMDLTLRFDLATAESIGEAMIQCVRKAEEAEAP